MATAAHSERQPIRWLIGDLYTVFVYNKDPRLTDADVVLDCFETNRQKDLNTVRRKDGVFHVQFPVPVKTQTDSAEILKEVATECLGTHFGLNKFRIALSIDFKLTTWKKEKFMKQMLTALHDLVNSDQKRYSGAVFMFCTEDDQTFDGVVIACERFSKTSGSVQGNGDSGTGVRRKQDATVVIEKGSLDTTEADMLACTISSDLDLKRGAVSNALLKTVGDQLQRDLSKTFGKRVPLGEIAVMKRYNLPCRHLVFGVLLPLTEGVLNEYDSREKYYRCSIHEFMMKCLDQTKQDDCISIAFPAIGTGSLNYPIHTVADEMFHTTYQWVAENRDSKVRHIKFVIYPADRDVLHVFKDTEERYEQLRNRETSRSNVYIGSRETTSSSKTDQLSNAARNVMQGDPVNKPNENSKSKVDNPVVKRKAKTYEMHVQNPEKMDNGEQNFQLPSENIATLIQYFYSEDLAQLEKNGCCISFESDIVCLRGKTEGRDFVVHALKKAIKGIQNMFVENFTLPADLSDTKLTTKINTVKEEMNVCCITDFNKRTITCFGKSLDEVIEARKRFEKLCGRLEDGCQNAKAEDNEAGASDKELAKMSQKTKHQSSSLSPLMDRNPKVFCGRTKEGVEVKVYSADVLSVPVDCIVNAANTNLDHGGGIAKAIAKAAGKELTREGNEYVRKHGELQVGDACHTGPGNLSCRIVIHVVGPCWSDYAPYSKENVNKCEYDLCQAIINSLTLAERCGMTSIGIPAISSGIYGCPEELCCVQYAKGVLAYSQLSKGQLQEIHFVDKNADIIDKMQQVFEVIIHQGKIPTWYNTAEYIRKQTARDKMAQKVCDQPRGIEGYKQTKSDGKFDSSSHDTRSKGGLRRSSIGDGYPYECSEQPHGHHKSSFTCYLGQHQAIHVYTSNILTLQAVDMLACGEISNGKGQGEVTRKILELGGKEYQMAKKEAFKSHVKWGNVVVCKGGKSNYKWVAHTVFNWSSTGKVDKDIQKAVRTIFLKLLDEMQRHKCYSLAMPLLGTGKGGGDPKICAERLWESLNHFSASNKGFGFRVHLVHLEKEKTMSAIAVIKHAISIATCAVPNVSLPHSQQRRDEPHHHIKKHVERQQSATLYPEPKDLKSNGKCQSFNPRTSAKRDQNSPQSTKAPTRLRGEKKPSSPTISHIQYQDKRIPEYSRGQTKSQRELDHQNLVGADDFCMYSERDVDESWINIDSDGNEIPAGNHSQVEREMFPESASHVDAGSQTDTEETSDEVETCVICMEDISKPETLPCGHTFCMDCIQEQFIYKEVCPTCGKVCGVINGDQPNGTMDVRHSKQCCTGYESYSRIEIQYTFPGGVQGSQHPDPGKLYKGISRTAYLPNNKQGKEICEMLNIAFDRKLVFTIGRSRTTGVDGVITWNDIHHKTDPRPNTQFGFPDPTYLDRVTEELKVKGVTINDIPTLSAPRQRRR